MFGNGRCPSGKFGDSLKLTNWILESGETCHTTPEVLDSIPGSLEETDKRVEVVGKHHSMEKKRTSKNKNVQQ